jgi:hypothetical protein
MISKTRRKQIGKDHLQRIIDLCRSVEEMDLDPFVVDIGHVIAAIQEYFPEWESPEEYCLDAETIDRIASIIKIQSEWIKHRSTSLYKDPFLLKEKIQKIDKQILINLFLQAWHPIVELEQISYHSLAESINYWKNLLPINERWQNTPSLITETEAANPEELVTQRILAEKTFGQELLQFWQELKQKANKQSKIRYWDFIGAETYPETLKRAYLTSFLVTYGYATLEIHPLEEELFIRPFEKARNLLGAKQMISVPISVSLEEWEKWKKFEEKSLLHEKNEKGNSPPVL